MGRRLQRPEGAICRHRRLAPATPRIAGTGNRRETAERIVELAKELSLVVDELTLVQARSRLEAVTIDPIRLDPAEALDIARVNRLDWMNNRAALVDSWRLIQFNADALQAGLDVVFSGDLSTNTNNMVHFHRDTGTLRVGLRFDAPFTRLLERNNFRQALIDYQRDRRQLIGFEDGVNQTLRSLLRQLDQLAVHALHALRQPGCIGRITIQVAQRDRPPAHRLPVELCDLFWQARVCPAFPSRFQRFPLAIALLPGYVPAQQVALAQDQRARSRREC